MTTMDRTDREFTLAWTLEAEPAAGLPRLDRPGPARLALQPASSRRPTDPIEVDLRVGGHWRQKMVIDVDTRT